MTEWTQEANPGWAETERLSMRPVSEADAPLFCDLYEDPETMRFVGRPLSRERAQRSFRIVLASLNSYPRERLFLVMVERATQQAIGMAAFQNFDAHQRRAEAGIVLGSGSRGRGFGTEGLRGLVAYAFAALPVDEVWIQHAIEHLTAWRVPHRLGFSLNTDTSTYGVAQGRCVWSAYRRSWRTSPSRAGTPTAG